MDPADWGDQKQWVVVYHRGRQGSRLENSFDGAPGATTAPGDEKARAQLAKAELVKSLTRAGSWYSHLPGLLVVNVHD